MRSVLRRAQLVASMVALLGPLCTIGWPATSASAADRSGVQFTTATVTAARVGGDSAVVVKITNHSRLPISVLSVSSPLAKSSMLGFDADMCNGATTMTPLSNILISPGSSQVFGYKNQGAMLSNSVASLTVGKMVPLHIVWSNFSRTTTTVLSAEVVAPPKGLHFRMAKMRM